MSYLILAINPGSTSTKIGLYRDEEPVFVQNIEHDQATLKKFLILSAQKMFRLGFVLGALAEANVDVADLDAVVGRGGLMPVLETGGYIVNDIMKNWITAEKGGSNAANLGSLMADLLAKQAGCDAYIYDAVAAGRLSEVASITGFTEIKRKSQSHVLNSRAQCIQYASRIGKRFEDLNIIVCHMGGGTSLSVYEKGIMKDSVADDMGPLSSDRSGTAPLMDFVNAFFKPGMDINEIKNKIRGGGGLVAHFGTADFREVEIEANSGDPKAALLVDAKAYNIAKSIGSLATVVNGRVDAIILTGGIAHSNYFMQNIASRVDFIADVVVAGGEYEMEAMVGGCLRIMRGEEVVRRLVDITPDGFGVSEIV